MATLQQLQQRLGISRSTFYRRQRDGTLPTPGLTIKGKPVWNIREIERDRRRWLNAEEVRDLLGFSESKLYRMVETGKFPKPTKRYGRRMWSKDQIRRLPKAAKLRYGPRCLWSTQQYELWENPKKIPPINNGPAPEQLRSVRDLCKDLGGSSKSSIYKWLAEGDLPPPKKRFGQKRWTWTDIKEYWTQLAIVEAELNRELNRRSKADSRSWLIAELNRLGVKFPD
jgi:predicted DNA-binding transcriptional regulator AlpA